MGVLTGVFSFFIKPFYLRVGMVYGTSMSPTYEPKSFFLYLKIGKNYKRQFKGGEVVVVVLKKATKRRLIKRVFALEGESVFESSEKTLSKKAQGGYKRVWTLKDREIFLVGDNLDESVDSRHFGLVQTNDVCGVVVTKLSFLNFV